MAIPFLKKIEKIGLLLTGVAMVGRAIQAEDVMALAPSDDNKDKGNPPPPSPDGQQHDSTPTDHQVSGLTGRRGGLLSSGRKPTSFDDLKVNTKRVKVPRAESNGNSFKAGLGRKSHSSSNPHASLLNSYGDVDASKFLEEIRAYRSKLVMQDPMMADKGIERLNLVAIEKRVAIITDMIAYWGMHPTWQRLASYILSQRCKPPNADDGGWCIPEQDYIKEAEALFNFVRRNVRYQRDPATIDTFSHPDRILSMGSGDCDDGCILLGTLLRASGVLYVKARVIAEKGAGDWTHIYLVANPTGRLQGTPGADQAKLAAGSLWVPMHNGKSIKPKFDSKIDLMAMDASQPQKFGWEAPGAKECAESGRPAGIVDKVRDFDVPPYPTGRVVGIPKINTT